MFSFKSLLLYFLKLGTIGFGGPIALVGYMQRDLVEKKKWIKKEDFLRGLTLSQLAPGPLAAQLAMYVGYLKGGRVGTGLVAIAFILPSFLMVIVLGFLYVRFGNLEWVHAIFYGIGACVIGIIIRSAYKLTKVTLKKKKLLWLIFLILGLTTAITQQENILLFILCGFIALFVYSPHSFIKRVKLHNFFNLIPLVILPPSLSSNLLLQLFLFFVTAGAFVFGSGLAIVPFLYGGVVNQHHWLTQKQFVDAVAVAMITPGPIVITAGFIGFLVAGIKGAIVAALGVFLPVYLFVIVLTPIFEKHKNHPQFRAFIEGLTAAATGGIAGAIIILSKQSITDIPTLIIALGTLFLIIRFKISEPILIGIAGILGLFLFHRI